VRPEKPLDPDPVVARLRHGPVSYTDTGRGRAVVGVHGLPASGRDFRWLDSAIKGRVRFVRPDLPGFGASPGSGQVGHTFRDYSRVISEFCEVLGLTDAIALGHSMGGAIAVDAAAQSSRIAALALVNSAGPVYHRAIFPRTYRNFVRLVDLHPVARRAMVAVAGLIARAMGFSKHVSDDELVLATRICAGYRPLDLEERLRHLAKPVLIAWSDDDPSVQPRVSTALIDCVDRPHSLRYPTGGHNLQSTRATELADAIVAWADTV
jgi:pimeloyl-ACP methyl ester carboxylesterase